MNPPVDAPTSSACRPDGSIPRLNRILFADAGATVVGSLAGTSPVVSYIESASGVSAGTVTSGV